MRLQLSETRRLLTLETRCGPEFLTRSGAIELRNALSLSIPLMTGDERQEQPDPAFQHVPASLQPLAAFCN